MKKLQAILLMLLLFFFLSSLHGFTGIAEGYLIAIDGLHIETILFPNLPPDYSAYLEKAINDSHLANLINEKIGTIAGFPWSRNIYDTEKTVMVLSNVLEGAYKLSKDANKPFVIVSHSWGTVLAYLAISANSNIIVDKFVTLGSPLNAQSETVNSFTKVYVDSANPLPNVRQWHNYWAGCDPISGTIPAANNNVKISTTFFDAATGGVTCHASYYADYAVWQQILLDVSLTKITTGSVSGKLHQDSASGPPLPGATVTCGGQSKKTASDGSFSLSGVPTGNQSLSFSMSGYQSYSMSVLITAGQTVDVGDRWLVKNPAPTPTCPSGNGLYCGDPSMGQNTNYLYLCTNGNYSLSKQCSNGCLQNPPGVNDTCRTASQTCPSGNGLYCGNSSLGQNPNYLYQCTNGNYSVKTACPYSCQVNPPGTNDVCSSTPPSTSEPDLNVKELTIKKSGQDSTHTLSLQPGEAFQIDVWIKNVGDATASKEFTINYLLSNDKTFNKYDRVIGVDHVKDDVKEDKTYHDSKVKGINAPSTPGTYYIGAWVNSPEDTNKQNDFSKGDDEIAKIIVASIPPPAYTGIELPKTGQTKCYDAAGFEIACTGTGQDGEIQAGVAWPNPKFTDNADGTITDNLTGLMWAKDAGAPTVGSCAGGPMMWTAALDYVACLNNNSYLGYSDWRLPNVNELESLINAGESNLSAWLASHGFINVVPFHYWSSTTSSNVVWEARVGWIISMWDGLMSDDLKSYSYYIWPVRGTTSGVARLWKTGQTISYYPGDDGAIQAGVAWPTPRFTNEGDATVKDNLSGLIWTKDANAPGPASCNPATSKTWLEALEYVACLNTNRYLGFNDWRLPNRKEFFSLIDYSNYVPALPNGHPFMNVQSNSWFWSSTTDVSLGYYAWDLEMGSGRLPYIDKTISLFVWPVRGGKPGPQTYFKLPDTGQTTCYDGIGNIITCPAPGQALAQDGSYNMNPLSYTDNLDGTTTDNNTGLMWQKQDDGNTYNWYQASGTYDAVYNASSFKNVCGELRTAGYADWRLPTKLELMGIVDYGRYYPSLDTTYFPAPTNYQFWSSTSDVSNSNQAWAVEFSGGGLNPGCDKFNGYTSYVRCVRGGNYLAQSFNDNGDGTITDTATGLIWQQRENPAMNWESALAFCEGFSLGGYSDWRLPNIKELAFLTDDTKLNPSINTSFFPDTVSSVYWASTTLGTIDTGYKMYISFDRGYNNIGGYFYSNNFRCVRGGRL